MTISIGPIRFLRSASRNSATVLASTPALRAARPAPRAVVLAVFRAFCCRARACPPFLAAARRFADVPELDADERELAALLPVLEDLLRVLEALVRLVEALPRDDPLDRFEVPPDLPLLRRSAIWLPLR
jgi:hypothetical protein